jgi:hypothetical protein
LSTGLTGPEINSRAGMNSGVFCGFAKKIGDAAYGIDIG